MKWGSVFVILAILILVGLSFFLTYQEVVFGTARVIDDVNADIIRIPEHKNLSHLLVNDNSKVNKGDIIAVLETEANWNDVLELDKELNQIAPSKIADFEYDVLYRSLRLGSIEAQFVDFKYRLSLLLNDSKKSNGTPSSILKSRLNQIENKLAVNLHQKGLLDEARQKAAIEVKELQKKYSQNTVTIKELNEGITQHKYLKKKLLELDASIDEIQSEKSIIKSQIEGLVKNEKTNKIVNLQECKESLMVLKNKINQWKASNYLTASIDGVFFQYDFLNKKNTAKALGYVSNPNNAEKGAIVYLNKEFQAKIEEGQKAHITINALPGTPQSVLKGKIHRIESSPEQEMISVHIKIEQFDSLQTGQHIGEGKIFTKRKSILDWILQHN